MEEELKISNIQKYNQRRKDYKENEIELEDKLREDWLSKGNKIKVFNRDFDDEDYNIGKVGKTKNDIYE